MTHPKTPHDHFEPFNTQLVEGDDLELVEGDDVELVVDDDLETSNPQDELADMEQHDEQNEADLMSAQKMLRKIKRGVNAGKKTARELAKIVISKDNGDGMFRFGEHTTIGGHDAGSDNNGAATAGKPATAGKLALKSSPFAWNDGQGGNSQLVVLGLHEDMIANTTDEDSEKRHTVYVWTKMVWEKGREVRRTGTTTDRFQEFAVR